MPGITLEQAQAQLGLYMAAEAAVLTGQSYRIGDRELKRADLAEIRRGIADWNSTITGFGVASIRRSRVIVPAG